jgi:hypothetical protein
MHQIRRKTQISYCRDVADNMRKKSSQLQSWVNINKFRKVNQGRAVQFHRELVYKPIMEGNRLTGGTDRKGNQPDGEDPEEERPGRGREERE